MALGVYGKHPAKGDFVEYGLPPDLRAALESWLDQVLAEARETLGPAWEQVWATAPQLRFWLGEAIWGQPVAGVLAPSRDRVGRRFPLVMVATGADAPPPPVTGGQAWHAALSAHVGACLAQTVLDQPAELVTEAPWPEAAEGITTALPPEFWAVRPGAESGALWEDVALADHRRAAAGRSYWWAEGAVAFAAAPLAEAFAEPEPEPAPEPEAAAEPEEISEAEAETAPAETDAPADRGDEAPAAPSDEDVWAVAGLPEDEGSPFDPAPGGGLSLFAAPEAGDLAVAAPAPAPVSAPLAAVAAAPPRPAQVWAGQGLPPGAVLAWFFKGHAGNG